MKREEFFQAFLERHLCGEHYKLKHGETDITNPGLHAEIKVWGQWKAALGQLLYYNHVCPRPELRLYLYGRKARDLNVDDVVQFLSKYNVTLYSISYSENAVKIINHTCDHMDNVIWDDQLQSACVEALNEEAKQEILATLQYPNSQTDFVVKVSLVAKWMNANKTELVKTLKQSYRENLDYTVVKGRRPNVKGRGANHNKEWLLTPDCFKRICMRTRCKMAEDVRSFLLQNDGNGKV